MDGSTNAAANLEAVQGISLIVPDRAFELETPALEGSADAEAASVGQVLPNSVPDERTHSRPSVNYPEYLPKCRSMRETGHPESVLRAPSGLGNY
ncbi:hypothetical protein OB919_08350 [Halobacteria archaeon AArc-curdl1]|uniref:Uncharacterized protein n=1 Tax=Natronosalvus hydrolyticus TaxID=2979988 RepID=A0AAP3E6M9_9EURY|nr:hypothetical protein [Halobacteria archaeon AArc-curdl1]